MNMICSKCKEEKEVGQFYKNRTRATGYTAWCKKCILDHSAKLREEKRGGPPTRRPRTKRTEPGEPRICIECGIEKDTAKFHKKGKAADGTQRYRSDCMECVKISSKKWREKYYTKNKFNLSPDSYYEMLEDQGGTCANPRCQNTPDTYATAFHVDHDHSCCPGDRSCGRCVRGLLCLGCNVALGFIKDDIDRAKGLGEYLEIVKANAERKG